MLVQAGLGGGLFLVVVGTNSELEESHMICGQLDADLDDLILFILSRDDAIAINSAGFVGTGLEQKQENHFWNKIRFIRLLLQLCVFAKVLKTVNGFVWTL